MSVTSEEQYCAIDELPPPIDPESILYSPGLVQEQRNGVYLLIDPLEPNWVSTNRLGSKIVRQCDGRRTMEEISAHLSREDGLTAAEVAQFVRAAVVAGIISTRPELKPAYPGRAQAVGCGTLEELWIYTNNSCLLRCKHCLVDGGEESTKPLSTSEIERLIGEALELGAKRVYFTGGEPFLRHDLFSLVEYVTARAELVILTSGLLLTDENVARLAKLGRGRLLLQVSLEGPDALTNDAIRGPGSFVQAVEGIRRLVQGGLSPVVTTTITRLNYGKVVDTSRFLASLGVRDHHVLWLHARGRMRGDIHALHLPQASVSSVMEELRQTTRSLGIVVDNLASLKDRVRSKRGRKNDLCNSCFGVLSVNVDGHAYPCAALSGAPEFDCGSIKTSTLAEIWLHSPVTNWIRENSVQKKVGCSSCFLKFFCGGGCFAQSYFDYELRTGSGCIMAPDPYCTPYKTQLSELMWELATEGLEWRDDTRPLIYRTMDNELLSCTTDGNKVLNAAFEVGTYHCACVLAMEAKGSA